MRISGTVGHPVTYSEREDVRNHMTGMPAGLYVLAAFDYGDVTDYEVHHCRDKAEQTDIARRVRHNGYPMFRVDIA